eukprot:gene9548-6704_t
MVPGEGDNTKFNEWLANRRLFSSLQATPEWFEKTTTVLGDPSGLRSDLISNNLCMMRGNAFLCYVSAPLLGWLSPPYFVTELPPLISTLYGLVNKVGSTKKDILMDCVRLKRQHSEIESNQTHMGSVNPVTSCGFLYTPTGNETESYGFPSHPHPMCSATEAKKKGKTNALWLRRIGGARSVSCDTLAGLRGVCTRMGGATEEIVVIKEEYAEEECKREARTIDYSWGAMRTRLNVCICLCLCLRVGASRWKMRKMSSTAGEPLAHH